MFASQLPITNDKVSRVNIYLSSGKLMSVSKRTLLRLFLLGSLALGSINIFLSLREVENNFDANGVVPRSLRILENATSDTNSRVINELYGTKMVEPNDSADTTQRLRQLEKTSVTPDTTASPTGMTIALNDPTAATTTSITTNASIGEKEKEPGFAACILVLDDTLRLYEWLPYHYTVLPLTSVIIGVDPKSTRESVTEIETMAERWSRFGLNITIWPMGEFERHRDRQTTFVQRCTKHFEDKKREKWLLLTDSDEFLSYNYIMPRGENITHFDVEKSIFKDDPTAPSVEERAKHRRAALPIRETLPDFHRSNTTILSFIQAQQANSSQNYFPKKNGCTRIVGLTYGLKTLTDTRDDPLMTRRYQHHKKPNDRFSKVFIELSKIKPGQLETLGTIHNPFPELCGGNGKHDSGQDFMGSVLRVNHYIGSLESWLERGGGRGTRVNSQSANTWRSKDYRQRDYHGPPDVRAGDWVASFVTKVGPRAAEELLFRPLTERIAFVKTKLGKLFFNTHPPGNVTRKKVFIFRKAVQGGKHGVV